MLDTWPKMLRLAFPDVACTINRTDQYATIGDNSQVWFGGLDDQDRVEKILGKEFATIYVNEASQVAHATVMVLRTRLAQAAHITAPGRDGSRLPLKAFYDLNPTGRSHWTHREFVERVRPENGLPLADPASRAFVVMNPADNPHLPPEYLDELEGLPDRQRQRFRDGKYLAEVPGALWSLEDRVAEDGRAIPGIESLRRAAAPPLTRVVIGVDPSGSDGTGGDHQGIVVAGLGADGHGYVLADRSVRLSPDGWARAVAQAARDHAADRVVAERNFGGAMVEAVLRGAARHLPVKLVTASRGKLLRAEPIAALYEQGKVHHLGVFAELEEQLCLTTTAGYQGPDSPDRMDALVWALTELMLGGGRYDVGALVG
jgi:predicted phage terminase large subunit-like protein